MWPRKVIANKMQKLLRQQPKTQQPSQAATLPIQKFVMYSVYALGLLLCTAQYAKAEGSGKILKWKDENGVTHYGDNMPSQYNNRENSQINRQGITVKHNVPNKGNADELSKLEQAKTEQAKKDKALLGAFTNVGEIDLALERNIQLDKIALDNLKQERATHQKSLDSKKATAATLEQKKKTVPKDLKADIADEQTQISRLDKNIEDKNAAISETRKRFEEDKKRYTLLKSEPAGQAQ
ncbi:conserved hypothetical protein [Methylotenera mobilis JLW8]|uniref:DUF4124 domain-containing protein n=2 Tax=Methylotenera mobilis TaxID=359408 RepID=C6WT89_METML|nr:conserved hypothetical protein [Methylotenera mobilis JLW8]